VQLRESFFRGKGMRGAIQQYTGTALWLGFFAFVLAAWALLFAMQPGGAAAEMAELYGSDFLRTLCAPITAKTGYGALFAMWALMSAAMMAPTFVPTLSTYRGLTHTEAAGTATFVMLVVSYLMVWLGFSGAAALAQLGLARAGLIGVDGISVSLWLSAALLLIAGAYQFSPQKDACLSKCRAPMMFFMEYWRPGLGGAARMGWKLGAICIGCCWALMLLGFVGGVMNPVWMGIATILMVLEKLPEIGRYITRPLGGALLVAGGLSVAAALSGV